MLAHPLLDPGGVRLPPISVAVVASLLVAVVGRYWPDPAPPGAGRGHDEVHSWRGRVGGPTALTRIGAVALLVVAVVAGRIGSTQELENLAPALVVGTAWPLLILGSALLGAVWRWLDPWDALARPLATSGEAGEDVRWAALPAFAFAWYLSVYPTPLDPRIVGLALAAYSIVTLGGSLVIGRVSWLSRVEVFGLVFGWTAMLRRGDLRTWAPPTGASVVLGVLAGGLVFGVVRRSALWGDLNVAEHALLLATAGMTGTAAAFAALLWWADRRADAVGARGGVAAALVPAVAAIAVASALSRNRLFTSVQLLPGLFLDPFGSGGTPVGTLDPDPLGSTGLVALQVAVVVVGHLVGALVLSRRSPADRRQPGLVALVLSVGIAAAALTVAQA